MEGSFTEIGPLILYEVKNQGYVTDFEGTVS